VQPTVVKLEIFFLYERRVRIFDEMLTDNGIPVYKWFSGLEPAKTHQN
jgi:hypothetical protein